MAERNLKLEYLTERSITKPNRKFKTPELAIVSATFLENARRLVYLGNLPFVIAHVLRAQERALAGALMKHTGDVKDVPSSHPQVEDIEATGDQLLMGLLEEQAVNQEAVINRSQRRTLAILGELARQKSALSGIEAFLAALVVNTWTAFETLSGDLWEAALNCHPKELAALTGGKAPKDDDGKTVPLKMLQKFGFDLSKSMGTLLKERNVHFDKLESIRENYGRAFGEGAVTDALADKSLDSLKAVRNLLVHCAGVVDDRYLNRTRSLAVPKAAANAPIELDGEIVSDLTKPVMTIGVVLLTRVDEW